MKDTTAEEPIPIKNFEEVRVILGPLDTNARLIRELHSVNVLVRDGELRLLGKPEDVAKVRATIEVGLDALRHGRSLTTSEVARMLRGAAGAADGSTVLGLHSRGNGLSPHPANTAHVETRKLVRPRTAGQERYFQALMQHDVVFGVGPAGTGKTYLAMAAAVDAIRRGIVHRIVLVRPAVEAGEKLGFLPGDFQAKVDPYLRPLYDALHDLLEPSLRMRYLESEVVEVCPLAYMRGRTLNDSFIILDEAQNTTVPQMLMFLTRLGEGSRMVVTGDPTQVDLPQNVTSGLSDALRRLEGVEGVHVQRLASEDVVRHRAVQRILEAYGKAGRPAPAVSPVPSVVPSVVPSASPQPTRDEKG